MIGDSMMQLGLDLSQKQLLKLAMTPELRQSINILNYSTADLVHYLHQQVNENPVIKLSASDSQQKDSFDTREQRSYSKGYTDDEYNPFNYISDQTVTLESHLLEQLSMLNHLHTYQKHIVQFLIGNLNKNGFLAIEPKLAAELLNVSFNEVNDMIHVLQSFDPIGVGAQNFVDSLLIQIKAKKSKPPLLYDVVKHDIEDIANKKYRNISKKYSISMREVQEIVDCLRTLNPRPAGDFYVPLTKYISPDVTVQKVDSRYHVILHSELLPSIEINSTYQKLVHRSACVTTDRYVQEKIHEATWLINSIEQRNATIYNVSKAIVEHQQDFFEMGISGLKPLTLKDIAQKVDCHESTVSRATNGKYIQTPRGLFELKYFFTNSLERTDGEQSNSTAFIKEKIKTLIAQENKLKPLSDQKLMSLLSSEGIQISRRTVAKYREEAGIESSSKRRRF